MSAKYFLIFSLLLLVVSSFAQAQDKPKHQTVLEAPSDWRPETIPLPLGFAPSIDYKGFEDVRFAPGWSDTEANDYFTYMFVWYLDEDPKLNAETLADHMKAYFGGLMSGVSGRSDLPDVVSTFKEKSTGLYTGYVDTYDAFFKKSALKLYTTVHSSYCEKTGKYLVRFNFSPKNSDDPLWKKFEEVKLKIDCGQ